MNKKAFTLVELIVVITILTILGTIAFISLQGYSKDARNSVRTSDIKTVESALEFFALQTGKYPLPGNPTDITASGGVVLWKAGEVDDGVMTKLGRISELPLDPKTGDKMQYNTTVNLNEYELKYEVELTQNNGVIDTALAATNSSYIKGTYNGLYTLADDGTYYAAPSLYASGTTLDSATDFQLNGETVNYQVTALTNSGSELITSSNIKTNYKEFGLALQTAYSTATELDSGIYAALSSIDDTTSEAFAKNVLKVKKTTTASSGGGGGPQVQGYQEQGLCDIADVVVGSYTVAGCNIGTTTSGFGDAAIGGYFQWGEMYKWDVDGGSTSSDNVKYVNGVEVTGDNLSSWSSTVSDTDSDLTERWGATGSKQGPCPTGWHVPSRVDWEGVIAAGGWANESDISTGLTLPANNGHRSGGDGTFWNKGTRGYYATSTPLLPNGSVPQSNYFYLSSSYAFNDGDRSIAPSVRCFKD